MPQAELDDDQVVTGVEQTGREEGDGGRAFANALLVVPRTIVDLIFQGTAAAANLVADEQLVPQYREIFGAPPGGNVFVFPTFFAETGKTFDVGTRFIADTERVTTFQRFGFGGPRDVVLESRAVLKGGPDAPFALSAEAFYELESEVEFHGLGIHPDRDPRNRFRAGSASRVGLYKERQVRGLGSLGMRWGPSFEFFLSASLGRRQVEDAVDAGEDALTQVFEPSSLRSVLTDTWIGYGELAARFDTRKERGGLPSPGVVAEGYAGGAHSTSGPPVSFMRIGWRLGSFIPVYRKTNIVAPRVMFDRLVPLNGLDVPFTELPQQTEFRGFDIRRDNVSMIAAIDYSWPVASIARLSLFLDAATVAPSVAEIGFEQVKALRYAAGVGFDIYSKSARLLNAALAFSPDGVRVHFSIGKPEQFGDRQHTK